MRGKFVKLMGTLRSALKKKIAEEEIDLDTLKTHLILRDLDHKEQFNDAQSVDALLTVIRQDCFFTNPDLLESLSSVFNILELKEEVERYRNELEDYYEQVLAEEFVKEGIEEYDKNANVVVSIFHLLLL